MENTNKLIVLEAVLAFIGLMATLFTQLEKAFTLTTLIICVINLVLVCKPKK